MCITAVAISQNPLFPIIIAHNRDEFRSRSFTPLDSITLPNNDILYSGIDIKSNGLWFGVTKSGKIGVITNVRDRSRFNPNAPSRGSLLKNFLHGQLSAYNFLLEESRDTTDFNPYNLILADNSNSFYYYNSDDKTPLEISSGIHVLCNAHLDTSWPKTDLLRQKFSDVVLSQTEENFDLLEHRLLEIMENEEKPEISRLPSTGVSLEQEIMLSSIYCNSPQYGTVSTTIYMLKSNGSARVTEYQQFGNGERIKRSFDI